MSQDLDQQVRQAVADFCRQIPRRYPFFSTVLGILLLVLIIWFIPEWQVPESGLNLKERLHQINENRKTVAQIVGGVFILVGLYIAWVRSKAMRDQAEVAREQQLTDLYVKAVEQLGSENLQIRLGGIYALERIARESPKDHWPIMEVLTAFVRENAPLRQETLTSLEFTAEEIGHYAGPPPSAEKPPIDIQAVLTILGRTAIPFAQEGEKRSLDLQATHLVGANLREANLQGALLVKSNLRSAYLLLANLHGADLVEANLRGAFHQEVNLQKAFLDDTNLQEAILWDVNLKGAFLNRANLQKADLSGANLQEAELQEANMQGAKLLVANLRGAELNGTDLKGALFRYVEGLTAEQVAEAIWDETTIWPEGFPQPAPLQKEDDEEE
jgi:uncharacterized protein YjbI with pentapeptide repeats